MSNDQVVENTPEPELSASPADTALDDWFQRFITNSVYSQNTAIYNDVHQAVQRIKNALASAVL